MTCAVFGLYVISTIVWIVAFANWFSIKKYAGAAVVTIPHIIIALLLHKWQAACIAALITIGFFATFFYFRSIQNDASRSK